MATNDQLIHMGTQLPQNTTSNYETTKNGGLGIPDMKYYYEAVNLVNAVKISGPRVDID